MVPADVIAAAMASTLEADVEELPEVAPPSTKDKKLGVSAPRGISPLLLVDDDEPPVEKLFTRPKISRSSGDVTLEETYSTAMGAKANPAGHSMLVPL